MQCIDVVAQKEAKISRNLLVAAASGVQLVTGRADQRDELLFYEVVNIFGFRIVKKFWFGFCALVLELKLKSTP